MWQHLDVNGKPYFQFANAILAPTSPPTNALLTYNGSAWQASQLWGYFSGASKTTVSDGDFASTPVNGAWAVHYDTSAGKTYFSVRANGTWHVMAGPV